MIAQAVLSLLLCGILVYAWVEAHRSPAIAVLALIAALMGLYLVWMPGHSTQLAELVGIGRGADLILYLWVCISLIVMLNLHLKLRTQHELLTALARKIALATVEHREVAVMAQDEADRYAAGAHRSIQSSARPA